MTSGHQKDGLGVLSWWCCVQGSCAVPCFCSWHLRNGSWFLASLYLIHNLPYLCMHAALFSPLFFLGILLLQEAFVQVQALQGKPRMPGSQVPDYLNRISWEVFLLFLENLRIGVQSSLNFCQNSPVKLPGPGLFFGGNFLITNPVFWLVVIYLFRLSISFLVSFVSF